MARITAACAANGSPISISDATSPRSDKP
jgi:hypothetical protein